ncbi:hypothetical protein EQV77_14330 [Halobacillus fulvus]|nr:hypothetical protein EQV77_14330 [Halobacillus fulvus]
MLNNYALKNLLFSILPHKEQKTCEKKLIKVIKQLKIEDYHFNWDRSSCYIEFRYKGEAYRVDHSVEKAKEKGILLRNGLDCINDLTQTLEDLSQIIDRGTYPFEDWIYGMKHDPTKEHTPEYEEEFHIKYRASGRPDYSEFYRNEEYADAFYQRDEEEPIYQQRK